MRKLPRHLPIHYEDYAPDLAPEQRKAFYGLPKNVQFCRECVMSNQKPNSCYEFEHTIHSVKKTMVIQEDGVCDACHACHNKEGKIDWERVRSSVAVLTLHRSLTLSSHCPFTWLNHDSLRLSPRRRCPWPNFP